jgi:hypothetical protein
MSDQDGPVLRALITAATEAAKGGDWDQAVDYMRTAVRVTKDPEMAAAAKKNLAVVLYSRAMRTADDGMARINTATEKSGEAHSKVMVSVAMTSRYRRSWKIWLGCFLFVAPIAWWLYFLYTPDEVWINPFWTKLGAWAMVTFLGVLAIRWVIVKLAESTIFDITLPGQAPKCWVCGSAASYRLDVPGHGERVLCGQHAGKAENAMQGIVADSKGVKMLRSAEKDLTEAKELDPELSQASQLLSQVGDVLRRLGRS